MTIRPFAPALALALVLALPAVPASAELGGALDRPDLLAYSSFPPANDGFFVSGTTYAGGIFEGNLSDVRTTTDTAYPGVLPLFVGGSGAANTVGGLGATLVFLLDEPDSIQRNAKKITVQQKAWLNVSLEGSDGMDLFATEPVDVESCSAKAVVKDRGSDGAADEGSVKVKCKSVEELITALGLGGAAADTVRTIFGTKKLKIGIKDTDGPMLPTP